MIDDGRRAEFLARGAAEWRNPDSTARCEARDALRESTWSAPVIEAALDNALWDLTEARAMDTACARAPVDPRPVLVILPGNVIGPAIASAYCAAAAGVSVILKSPGVERALAPVVARQFDRLGPPLAGSIDARYWIGGDAGIESLLFASVRRIIVFGGTATCDEVAQKKGDLPAVMYGDAFSVGLIGLSADISTAAHFAAQDICMFDQRGCMSPQTVYVEGSVARALLFAHGLAAALERVGRALPRAHVSPDESRAVAASIRQFAVTAVAPKTHGLDTVLLGPKRDGCPEFVVAVEPCGPPSCAGFGRIVTVMPCTTVPPVDLSGHLDTLGIAGERSKWVDQIIDAGRPARICALGEMQRPPFGYRPSVEDFL